jgi:hypothetical protein
MKWTVNISGSFLQRLETLATAGEEIPTEVWEEVGNTVIDGVMQNILLGGRPMQFAPLKKGWGRPLVGNQVLMNSGRIEETRPDGVTAVFGEGHPGAKILQEGGVITQIVTPKQANFFYAKSKETNIPSAREMWKAMYIKYRSAGRKGLVPPLKIPIPSRPYAVFARPMIDNVKAILSKYLLGGR